MWNSCAAKADSCEGSAKVPVTRCMLAGAEGCTAASRLGLAAAVDAAASRSGSSLRRETPFSFLNWLHGDWLRGFFTVIF